MKFWLIQIAELLPGGVDCSSRKWPLNFLSDSLINKGHDVVWWSSTYIHTHKKYRSNAYQELKFQNNLTVKCLHSSKAYNRNVSIKRILYNRDLANAFLCKARSEEHKPDLILSIIPTLEMCDAAGVLAKTWNVPLITHVYDVWPDSYLNVLPKCLRNNIGKLLLWTEYRRLRNILTASHSLTAVSEQYLKWAISHRGTPQKITDQIFPLGYGETLSPVVEQTRAFREKYKIPQEAIIVSFIGTFGKFYDVGIIIKAAKRLRNSFKNVFFVIAGKGDNEKKLKKLAMDLPNVIFTGWLDSDDLSVLKHLSYLGCLSYNKAATQSFPFKMFDYISSGVPIISSLKGDLYELIETKKIGLNYEAENLESFIKTLFTLLTDCIVRQRYSENAFTLFNQKYNANLVYNQFADYLISVAQGEKSKRVIL